MCLYFTCSSRKMALPTYSLLDTCLFALTIFFRMATQTSSAAEDSESQNSHFPNISPVVSLCHLLEVTPNSAPQATWEELGLRNILPRCSSSPGPRHFPIFSKAKLLIPIKVWVLINWHFPATPLHFFANFPTRTNTNPLLLQVPPLPKMCFCTAWWVNIR